MGKTRKGEWVEIVVAWGDQVLAVRHLWVEQLAEGRCFWLGDGAEPCDFVLAPEELGSARFALVDALEGVPHLHVPPSFERNGGGTTRAVAGAAIPLVKDQKSTVTLGALTFHVRLAPPEEAPKGALLERFDRSALAWFAGTFGTAAALFGALAYSAPPLWADDDAMVSPEHLVLMRQLLEASAEREEERKLTEGDASDANSSASSEPKSDPTPTPVRSLVSGPRRSDTPGPSRAEMLSEARGGGAMVALLNSLPGALPVPWGNVPSAGQLAMADAGMFGEGLGEGIGGGSLDWGNGSGGLGSGVHIDGVAGLPGGPGGRGGFGTGTGGPGLGDHKTRSPNPIRIGTPQLSGRMPPEVIQRIVRQNFGRLRMCYEQGLGRNPNLEGRVEVRFLIGSDGRVTSASAGASSLADSAVTSCAVSMFYSMSFPSPESGSVRVTYPISFVPQ
jgi:TonB family protein